MAEAKLLAWLFYGVGIPIYGYAMYINITTWKSDVLFVAALILVGIETYWKIRKNKRADYKAWQEQILRELEIEKQKKHLYGGD